MQYYYVVSVSFYIRCALEHYSSNKLLSITLLISLTAFYLMTATIDGCLRTRLNLYWKHHFCAECDTTLIIGWGGILGWSA